MAKSHAQRQKEYRERQKAKLGSKWLENESKRTVKYYKKVEKLSKTEAAKRREQLRLKQTLYRYRKKVSAGNVSNGQNDVSFDEPCTSTSKVQVSDISSSSSETKMVVKLNYARRNKSEKKMKQKIDYLLQCKQSLRKKNNALRRAMFRLKQKAKSHTKATSPKTPKSSTEKIMTEAGLIPNDHQVIRKKLMFAECMSREIRCSMVINRSRKGSDNVKKILAGSVLKKYKLTQYAANLLGIRIRSTDMTKRPEKKIENKGVYKKVKTFLEREDNSRQLPGKSDTVKNEKKEKVQKYVLNDYMRNIFMKFKAEYPTEKINFATFCRARPRHVTLVNYAARVTCLCTKHQNFALRLQCLKRHGVTSNTSPDNFSETTKVDEFKEKLQGIQEERIGFKQWKRVKCDDGKVRTKLLDTDQNKAEFTESVMREFEEFKDHVSRVKTQYQAFKEMKESLGKMKKHVIVQMDFSENYNIKEMEEIQSAYWNQEAVTLHPVVMYYDNNGSVSHSSLVVVSEVLNHNSSMVQAILEKVILWVKGINPAVEFIHYWTDSPTSQYRNKIMFDVVARHPHLFGIHASWHFFEAGHGKGACDGIGGVVKRTADTALKSGKINLACARDFYEWGVNLNSKIEYEYITKAEYDGAKTKTDSRQKQINTIKGTLKIHAVVGVNVDEVIVRETTCTCTNCFTENSFIWSNTNTCGWRKERLVKESIEDQVTNMAEVHTDVTEDNAPENEIVKDHNQVDESEQTVYRDEVSIGDFVAAKYDKETYIGKVVDIDEGLYEVKFMENGTKVKDCLKWPVNDDIIRMNPNDIICKVGEPMSSGKGKRFFKLSQEDRLLISEKDQK